MNYHVPAGSVEEARAHAETLLRSAQRASGDVAPELLAAELSASAERCKGSWPERGRPDPVRGGCTLGGQLTLEVSSTVVAERGGDCTCSCAAPLGWDAAGAGQVIAVELIALGYRSGNVEILFNFQDGARPPGCAPRAACAHARGSGNGASRVQAASRWPCKCRTVSGSRCRRWRASRCTPASKPRPCGSSQWRTPAARRACACWTSRTLWRASASAPAAAPRRFECALPSCAPHQSGRTLLLMLVATDGLSVCGV